MRDDEFLRYVNGKLPTNLGTVTGDDLRLWREWGIFNRPECEKADLRLVMGILKVRRQAESKAAGVGTGLPVTAGVHRLYQVVVVMNPDREERSVVLRALRDSGLISLPGILRVMPYESLVEAMANAGQKLPEPEPLSPGELEVSIHRDVFEVQTTGEVILQTFWPELVIRGAPVRPTLVFSTYLFQGRHLGDQDEGERADARQPKLYREFLRLQAEEKPVEQWLAQNGMLGFAYLQEGSSWQPYVAQEQERMRELFAQVRDRKAVISGEYERLMPYSEEGFVAADAIAEPREWLRILSSSGETTAQLPMRESRIFLEDPREPGLIWVRRFLWWIDYLWASLLDDLLFAQGVLLCARCGLPLESARGNLKYCPDCRKFANAEKCRRYRAKLRSSRPRS